ncbi:oligosaccharide flippase family protein [Thermoflavimicrobium dichotomicum]|uniref:Membrane protein involved in the export of O-antigen and teichoic acid n=1 Tax=Thermoflavimicrobium dichotomicum TaxID=46223 RepID=A0A1I3NB55_9BACL|nr:oligosaccharide flippase family protein [Thermoflavimicrobium dichotomicum]SFJ06429.1 Membrane protein involved in the export of O-antigen and teichoic acid [Thermoflavimicrobium dichotomicum]
MGEGFDTYMTLVKHSLIYFIARGLSGLINLCAIGVYTRLTSPEEFGKYVMVLAVVEFVNAVLFHWIRYGILRYSQRYTEDQRGIFLSTIATLFFIMFIFTLILSQLVLWVLIDLGKWGELWQIGLVLLWIMAWFDLNLELLRADLSPGTYGWMLLGKSVLTFICIIVMLNFDMGAKGFIIGMMTGMLFPLIFVMKRNWKGIRIPVIDPNICKQMITYGLPLTITFSMHFVMVSSDRLILGWIRGPDESGLYAVAYDLTQQTLLLVMTIINLSAFPLVVHALENGEIAETHKKLQQYTTALFFVSFPATAGFIVLAPGISRLFLGPDFLDVAFTIMPLIAFTAFLEGTKQYYLDLSFQLGQRTWFQIWPNIIAACANVGFNFLWIPKWGVLGAVYATIVANLMAIVMSWFIGRKIFPLPFPSKEILKIVLATLMMVFILKPLATYSGFLILFTQIVLGLFIYISVGYVLKIGGYHRYFKNILGRMTRKR